MLAWLSIFIPEKATYFGIRLFHFAVMRNHLHMLILAEDRKALSNFLRVVTGVSARRALGAEKGRGKRQKMWDARPYSRVLSWGREFENVLAYIERNILEALRRIRFVARDQSVDVSTKRYIAFRITPQLTLRV